MATGGFAAGPSLPKRNGTLSVPAIIVVIPSWTRKQGDVRLSDPATGRYRQGRSQIRRGERQCQGAIETSAQSVCILPAVLLGGVKICSSLCFCPPLSPFPSGRSSSIERWWQAGQAMQGGLASLGGWRTLFSSFRSPFSLWAADCHAMQAMLFPDRESSRYTW